METSLKEICNGLPEWAHYLVFVGLFLWEFWLGKTGKLKANSTIELLMNALKPSAKGEEMEIAKGLVAEYKDGKVVLSYEVKAIVVPALDALKAKVDSGEIDPIKGTDLDKEALLKAIDFLKAEVSK